MQPRPALPDVLPPRKRRGRVGHVRLSPSDHRRWAASLLALIVRDRASSRPGSAPSIRPRWRRRSGTRPPVGAILVRHRHAGPRRLFARAVRRAGVADRRLLGGVLRRAIGMVIGLVSGFVRWMDAIVMRVMDGLMSIPSILLAIALMALTRGCGAERHHRHHHRRGAARGAAGARRGAVACASSPMSRRRSPSGTRAPKIILRHILPNTLAPLTVQATFICAVGHDHRGDPVASSAPARRRPSRPGATSWPRAARSGR